MASIFPSIMCFSLYNVLETFHGHVCRKNHLALISYRLIVAYANFVAIVIIFLREPVSFTNQTKNVFTIFNEQVYQAGWPRLV
jgi:hypothetical protein